MRVQAKDFFKVKLSEIPYYSFSQTTTNPQSKLILTVQNFFKADFPLVMSHVTESC